MSEGATAVIFYVSVGALIAGTIRSLRASVERRVRDRIGLILAGAGAVGLVIAVIAFANGPKGVLPF